MNLGDRAAALERALAALEAKLGSVESASFYLSEPISPILQPEFLNTVAIGKSAHSARALWRIARDVELALGRKPDPRRDAPRTIDVDLLLVGEESLSEAELEIPHPRLRSRRFVLEPLAEVAPDWRVPPDGRTVAALLAELPTVPWVRRWGSRRSHRSEAG